MKRWILILTALCLCLAACSRREEVPEPGSQGEPSPAEEVPGEASSQEEPQPEPAGTYGLLMEKKEELLPLVQSGVEAYRTGQLPGPQFEEADSRFALEELLPVESADGFILRRCYGGDDADVYAAVTINGQQELRLALSPAGDEITRAFFAGRWEEDFYDWELSEKAEPRTYPTQTPPEGWQTNHTDWYGNDDPTTVKYPNWNGLEVRNWADREEYITIRWAVPGSAFSDGPAPTGEVVFQGPERWVLGYGGDGIINWDGGFAQDPYTGKAALLKIGGMSFGPMENWTILWEDEEILGSDFSLPIQAGAVESDEVAMDCLKVTDKYQRYVTAAYAAQTEPSIVWYMVDVGEGYGVAVYFFISGELTPEDLAIYDAFVETMEYQPAG